MNRKYFPVLRWKDGEKTALTNLPNNLRSKITPIIEVVPHNKKSNKDVMETLVDFLEGNYSGHEVFIDGSYLKKWSLKDTIECLENTRTLFGTNAIPIINYQEDKDTNWEKLNLDEIGLRVQMKDAMPLDFLDLAVADISEKANVELKDIVLILDYKISDFDVTKTIEIINGFNKAQKVKSVVLISGAYPASLAGYSVEEIHEFARKDWELWEEVENGTEYRLDYGDYGVRYPIYNPPKNARPTFSVGYTGNNKWFVFRGLPLTVDGSQGFKQFIAHAVRISSHEEYKGADFSYGDAFIKEKSEMIGLDEEDIKTGGLSCWIGATTNHHIHLVNEQLEKTA